ncbi:MAG: hypothetical protein Q8P41_24295 [Pseudomonadota bacterium]|nr:hypothetical protein [Pseudomonadota bacterium]
MADVEVVGAELADGQVKSLRVRFKHTTERVIDRATALTWLADGHSLLTYAGPAHHGERGYAIERVDVDGDVYLRTDTKPVAKDELRFPAAHH